VQLDGNLSVYEAHRITTSIEQAIKQQFDEVSEFNVIVEPLS
jgi:divalent metal cation (Fe/Co/Zn/Cd) transporter